MSLHDYTIGSGTARLKQAPPSASFFAPFLDAFRPNPEIIRDLRGLQPCLGQLGSMEVRLATTRKDIRRAQKLRYKVFYEEMAAIPDSVSRLSRRDKDAFDRVCDHLIVIDHEARSTRPSGRVKPRIVGTYRLLRQDIAHGNFGFYSESEFDVAPIMAANPDMRFLELGRSCVLKSYRTKRTVELLWQGIWTYVQHHRIDVMLGCASLEGTEPEKLAVPLGFLHHHAGAKGAWNIPAIPHRRIPMDLLAKDAIDTKRALHALPPLIKAYLRLGARFGDGAVIDHQFGTTDVLVILKVADIDQRYISHYGDIGRQAA
jgi:L-ornithine Nalpha-acyltransferase